MRGAISSGQEVEFSWAFISDAIYHASLPITIYVLTSIGGWMLLMKSSTIAALEEDFVTAARARGVPEWRVLFFYVGRNAILPLFTQLTIAIGFVVGGSLLVEPIFQYEGIGQRLFQALQRRDYTVLQGIFLVITISVVFANLIADLLYSRLDPRIRYREVTAMADHVITPAEIQTATDPAEFAQPAKPRGFWRTFAANNKTGAIAFAVFLAILALAFIGPLFMPDTNPSDGRNVFATPSRDHWLGTDYMAKDTWYQIVMGGREPPAGCGHRRR